MEKGSRATLRVQLGIVVTPTYRLCSDAEGSDDQNEVHEARRQPVRESHESAARKRDFIGDYIT